MSRKLFLLILFSLFFSGLKAQGTRDGRYFLVMAQKYAHGDGVEIDTLKAIDYYKKSIECGFNLSKPLLALLYENQRRYAEAFPLYLSFASTEKTRVGDNLDLLAISRIKVGEYKLEGKGTTEDDALAVNWLKKALDIDWGGFAHTMLGYCYLHGEGTEKDSLKAFNYFKIATEKYNGEAGKIALATCYVEGIGCHPDYAKVYSLLDNATDNKRSTAQLLLGIAYYKDSSISDHYTKAVYWLQLSANNTHKKNAAAAMYWLAKCYRFGRGVVKDIKKAEDLENIAAREGDEKALGLSRLLQRSQF